MKTMTITATIFAACASTAMADSPNMMMGCEIVPVEGGGYFNKADPACEFSVDATASGGESTNKPELPEPPKA